MRLKVRLVVLAILLAAFTHTSAGPAAADYRLYCNPEGDSRQVVILVHGFRSAETTWSEDSAEILSGGGTDTCVTRFDYSDHATRWVTNDRIGPALADYVVDWAEKSEAGGGTGRIVIVAHSMGGLATRCALSPECGGVEEVAEKVAHVTTFGTPNLGSFWRGPGGTMSAAMERVVDLVWLQCKARHTVTTASLGWSGDCDFINGLARSEASQAFTPGSSELADLPHFPRDFPVFAAAGNVNVRTSVFDFTTQLGSAGDLVVGVDSAHDEAEHIATSSPSDTTTVQCGTIDLSNLARVRVDDGGVAIETVLDDVTCTHMDEPTNENFLNRARWRINDTIAISASTPLISARGVGRFTIGSPLADYADEDPNYSGEGCPAVYVRGDDFNATVTLVGWENVTSSRLITQIYLYMAHDGEPQATTAEGIGLGSTVEELLAAYPHAEHVQQEHLSDPGYYSDWYIVRLSGVPITFSIDEGAVKEIGVGVEGIPYEICG